MKHPFRIWLNKQLRKKLTYSRTIQDRNGVGWTTEDFVEEAKKRGISGAKMGTANKWCVGTKPRILNLGPFTKAFPGIQF